MIPGLLRSAAIGVFLLAPPAFAEPVSELEPFLEDGVEVTGTPAGNGVYESVKIGKPGEQVLAERLTVSVDGNRLTDLLLENVSVPQDGDEAHGTIERVIVENSAIPLDFDDDKPEEAFEWLLNLDADRLAIEGLVLVDPEENVNMRIKTFAAENVVDGYFSGVRLSGLEMDGIDDDGRPFKIDLDRMAIRGFGAGWLLMARAAVREQEAAGEKNLEALADDDAAFMDAFKLADYLHHLRFQGIEIEGLTIATNGAEILSLASYESKATDYSGQFPVAGTSDFSGQVNLSTAQSLSADNPQAQLGLQAFVALYGQPTVAFSGSGQSVWSAEERTITTTDSFIQFERLARIGFDLTMKNYDPSDFVKALMDPNDDLTMENVMTESIISQLGIRIIDLGALDIGFSLAPPGIDRSQIAAQAAQFAGIGVVQAMQLGIEISGSVAEIVAGFIQNGGTIEVRLQDGSEVPMAPFEDLASGPEGAAKAMQALKDIKLVISGSQ